jgi:hypothetical protein
LLNEGSEKFSQELPLMGYAIYFRRNSVIRHGAEELLIETEPSEHQENGGR